MLASSKLPIRRHGGDDVELPAVTRLLEPGDLDLVYGLHLGVMRQIDDFELVRAEARSFFSDLLGGSGKILGTFFGEALIAYGILQFRASEDDDLGTVLGLQSDARVAKLAGTSVDPLFRGNGLQRYLVEQRIHLAHQLGYDHAYATASPKNHYSWRNLMRGGLQIAGIRRMYGGLIRYVLYADLAHAFRPDPATAVEVRTSDSVRQAQLIREGYRGYSFDDRKLRTISFAKSRAA